jgi:hypothetical protein
MHSLRFCVQPFWLRPVQSAGNRTRERRLIQAFSAFLGNRRALTHLDIKAQAVGYAGRYTSARKQTQVADVAGWPDSTRVTGPGPSNPTLSIRA